jgi:hypothetical protein
VTSPWGKTSPKCIRRPVGELLGIPKLGDATCGSRSRLCLLFSSSSLGPTCLSSMDQALQINFQSNLFSLMFSTVCNATCEIYMKSKLFDGVSSEQTCAAVTICLGHQSADKPWYNMIQPFLTSLWTSKQLPTFIWVNYNISLTGIKAIWGWFP